LAEKLNIADKPWTRIKGLLGRKSLGSSEALLIKPCNSIHTFFMQFNIDCLFLDKKNSVTGILSDIKPFRLSPIYWSGCCVIEFSSGVLKGSNTQLRDIIEIID